MTEVVIRLSYDLPNAYPLSDADQERLEQRLRMTREELITEAWRLRLVLAFGDLRRPAWAKDWLTERLGRCRQLLKEVRDER